LALAETLLDLADLGALQVAQFQAQPLHAAGQQGQGGEVGGVAVALHDLSGDGVGGQSQALAGQAFHLGVQVGVAAHGAGDLAHAHALQGGGEAFSVAEEFGVKTGQLEAEAGGFGMDAVGAADGQKALVAAGHIPKLGQKAVQAAQNKVSGPGQKHAVGRVHDVRGGAAQMDEAGRGTARLLHGGQDGDDVVAGPLLDLENAVHVEIGRDPDMLHVGGGDDPEFAPGLAHGQFHFEPDPEAVFQGPQAAHFRAGVAFDHGARSPVTRASGSGRGGFLVFFRRLRGGLSGFGHELFDRDGLALGLFVAAVFPDHLGAAVAVVRGVPAGALEKEGRTGDDPFCGFPAIGAGGFCSSNPFCHSSKTRSHFGQRYS
jgi:hypothetical protein